MYIPTLLFGHLLTGSNFNDNEKRLTGGRHGYGAKLTNVFSQKFIVEIRNTKGSKVKKFQQIWENNMHTCHEPIVTTTPIEECNGGKELDYTRITFVPDLSRLTGGSDDTTTNVLPEAEYQLMKRRVVDIAGTSNGKLTVTLNGEVVNVNSFDEYINLYRQQASSSLPMVYQKLNTRWEVSIGLSDTKSNQGLESISFVNGMNTSRGGTHVDIIAKQVSQYIADYINTKMSKQLEPLSGNGGGGTPINVTPRMVKRHLLLCVNSLIENPSFDSQMKECLTTNPENFGTTASSSNSGSFELPKSYLKKLVKPMLILDNDSDGSSSDSDTEEPNNNNNSNNKGGPGIVEEVLRMAMGAQQVNMAKLLKEVGACRSA